MKDSDEDNLKQLSNPISTGGGGVNFEYNVQSLFVVLMLTGGVAPCLPAWPIVEIKLQAKYAGYKTDDFVAFVQEPNAGRRAKLLAQIKRDITVGENPNFAKVIKAMWADYCDAEFSRDFDAVALITGPISSTDCSGVRTLLHTARTSGSASDFITKIALSSQLQRTKLSVFRKQLADANGAIELTDEELWHFLKCFYLVGYDLELPNGSSISLIQSLLRPYGINDVEGLWAKIREAISWNDMAWGTLNPSTVPARIRELFEERKQEATIPEEFAPPPSSGAIEIPDDITAEALKFAAMLGGWNENVPGDKEIIEELITSK